MTALTAVREVQIPLLAAMLLGGCLAKLLRTVRLGLTEGAVGPTALFPANLRKPVAFATCAVEAALGAGLVVTAGGAGPPATSIRIATCVLFLVFTSALIELRASRPGVGCGCFGELSNTPAGSRTIIRSALLAGAALATVGLPPISTPPSVGAAAELVGMLLAELVLVGVLSPEIGEGLVRLGYTEPCELKDVPVQRTVAALRRSKQWRRYAPLVTADSPADVWRELCWRYVVYPGRYQDRPTDLVFAIFLQQRRRPAVRVALVDASTGEALEWPGTGAPGRERRARPRYVRVAARLGAELAVTPAATQAPANMPFSSDI